MNTIIYIGNFELPDKNAAAHRVINNGKIFREIGYNVVYIGIDKNLNGNIDVLSTEKKYYGFTCYSIPYPKNKKQWFQYLFNLEYFMCIYKLYKKDVSYVICYNYPAILIWKILEISKKNNFKVIADCTEWYDGNSKGIIFKMIKGLDSFFRMRITHKKLDGLILISNYLMNYYSNYKKVLIPPLVDIKDEKWQILPADLPKDKINLVYTGSPGANKDKLDLIIKALGKYNLDNINLYIIGITKDECLSLYIELSDCDIILKNVYFLGRKSHLECISYLKAADYTFILRNKNIVTEAGFPTKFVEATTLGIPVIATGVGEVKYYKDLTELIILPNNHDMDDILTMLHSLEKKCRVSYKLNNIFDYSTKKQNLIEFVRKNEN